MTPLRVRPSPLLSTRTTWAFVDGVADGLPFGNMVPVNTREAPASPHGVLLRRLRRALRLTLIDAADAFGLRVSEVSDVERGLLVMSSREFVRACRLLCEVRR